MIPDAPILSNVMWRRCIGDILKRPRVCGARPDRTLYCYASACVTQQESAMRPGLPSAVFKLFGASYRPCASRTEISKCILKDIFAFPAPRYAGGIRSGEECVLVWGVGGREQRGRARNFMKYIVAGFADELFVGDVTNILTILCNKFIPGIVKGWL